MIQFLFNLIRHNRMEMTMTLLRIWRAWPLMHGTLQNNAEAIQSNVICFEFSLT